MGGRRGVLIGAAVVVALLVLAWLAYRPQRFFSYGASELASSVKDGAGGKIGTCIAPGGRDLHEAGTSVQRRGIDILAKAHRSDSDVWLCHVATEPISGSGASYLVLADEDGSWRGFEVIVTSSDFPRAISGRVNVLDYIN